MLTDLDWNIVLHQSQVAHPDVLWCLPHTNMRHYLRFYEYLWGRIPKADPNKEKFNSMSIKSGSVDYGQSVEPQRHKLFELQPEAIKEPWQEDKTI